jgi:hypothetical protein
MQESEAYGFEQKIRDTLREHGFVPAKSHGLSAVFLCAAKPAIRVVRQAGQSRHSICDYGQVIIEKRDSASGEFKESGRESVQNIAQNPSLLSRHLI